MVLENTKQNKGCWAEVRAFKTSKLQYSRPDKQSEAKPKVEQDCHPIQKRGEKKREIYRKDGMLYS